MGIDLMKWTLWVILGLGPGLALGQNASNVIAPNAPKKDTSQQTDLIDIARDLFHFKEKKVRETPDKKVYFSILPFSSTVSGSSGRALINSTSAGIYLGPRRTTNISNATFAPYWDFGRRFGLPLHTSVWFPGNSWTIQGDTRFLVYPQYTWGLGTRIKNKPILLDYNYVRFYQSALKRIKPYLFVGAGYSLDYHFNVKSEDPNQSLRKFSEYNYGTGRHSFSSGLSLDLLYDTRNNSINPLPGAYGSIIYRINPAFLGSNTSWYSLYLDLRKYIALDRSKPLEQNTLALWSYFWTAFNSRAPYLDLPSTGWEPYDRSGRGIDQNRYRGKSLYYFEAEYRKDLTRNGLLGFVLFTNITSVSGSGTLFENWHPAAGTGLRIKFNKGSGTNIGIDFGFSNSFSRIIFNLGEAF